MTLESPEATARATFFDAAIIDLDGLLIDSEPLWRSAEMEVFRTVGLELTEAECHQTTGLRTDQVVAYWLDRRPWDEGRFPADLTTLRINQRVIELIGKQGTAKAGVAEALDYFRGRDLRIGLASSSATPVIEAAIARLGIADDFDVVHSADFEQRSKPAPDVYFGAARRLGVAPSRCVALEDSVIGLSAAKAAKMSCIWIPEQPGGDLPPSSPQADVVLTSLTEIDDAVFRQLVAQRQGAHSSDG